MKPRLESSPLTWEDRDIWHRIMWRPLLLIGRRIDRVAYLKADIRDADLMSQAQHNRWSAVPWDWPNAQFVDDAPMLRPMIFCCGPVGGDIGPGKWRREHDITSCA